MDKDINGKNLLQDDGKTNLDDNSNINTLLIDSLKNGLSVHPHVPKNKSKSKKSLSTRAGHFHQILITFTINLVTTAYGVSLAYSAIFLPQIRRNSEPLKMTADMESWFAISTSIAAPVGSYIAGYLTERYGLRKTIMFSVFPAVLGWLGIGWATTHLMLFTGRCVLGAAFGLANAVYQVYLAECSDPYIRSVSLNISYVALSLGVVLVYWLGSVFHWHSIALFNISLPILSYIALYFSPESPVWLVRNNRVDEALTTMTWLRGNNQMAIEEIKEISRRIEHERIIDSKNNKKLGFCDELRAHGSLKPFLAINVFIILMTLGGGYLFVIYAVDIVAGLDKSIDSFKVTTLCGLIRLIINILFCPLFYYVKRRPIYIVSGVGAGISVLLLGGHLYACENRDKSSMEVYFDCFLMLAFIALSTTFTVAPTFMIGELLPSKVRARIAGYLHANYGFTFFVFGKFLPLVSACYKIYTVFLIFGLATLVSTLLVFLFLPETKDKTLNQIEDYFKHTNWIYSKRRFEECSQLANAELMEKNSQP